MKDGKWVQTWAHWECTYRGHRVVTVITETPR